MATVGTARILGQLARPSRVELLFWSTLLLSVTFLGLFWCVGQLERLWVAALGQRLVTSAVEATTLYTALPHYFLGFLFLVTAKRNRPVSRQLGILAFLLCGLGLCWLFSMFDTRRPYALLSTTSNLSDPVNHVIIGLYCYFLIHDLRDASFFYQSLGDAPPVRDTAGFQNMVRGLIVLLIAGLCVLGWPGAVLGWYRNVRVTLPGEMANGFAYVVAFGPLVLWLIACRHFLKKHARESGGAAALVRTHAPLFRLYLSELVIVVVGLVLLSRPYMLFIYHHLVWVVFSFYILHTRRPSRETGTQSLWSWMRTTPAGFAFLFVGLTLGFIGVGAVWTYGMAQSGWLTYLVSPRAFPYWAILHITVSFMPR